MTKLKEGDRVKILAPKSISDNRMGWTYKMECMIGKVYNIEAVLDLGGYIVNGNFFEVFEVEII
jgi:hypothetical protein